MKKIVMVIVAVALIAAGVFGTLAVQRTFEPSISLSSTSIQEQLSDCSELATAKLDSVSYTHLTLPTNSRV